MRPIVMIHGAGDCPSVWDDVGEAVHTGGVAWFAPALPTLTRPGSIPAYAGAVIGYVEELGLADVVLAGHSMGSLVALDVAATCPEWLDALVLICSGFPMRVSDTLLNTAMTDPDAARSMIDRWTYRRGFAETDPDTVTRHRTLVSQIDPSVLAADLDACDTYAGGAESAGRVAVPTTFVLAAEDRMVAPETAAGIRDHLRVPHDTIVLDGVGHSVEWEAPEPVAEALVRVARKV